MNETYQLSTLELASAKNLGIILEALDPFRADCIITRIPDYMQNSAAVYRQLSFAANHALTDNGTFVLVSPGIPQDHPDLLEELDFQAAVWIDNTREVALIYKRGGARPWTHNKYSSVADYEALLKLVSKRKCELILDPFGSELRLTDIASHLKRAFIRADADSPSKEALIVSMEVLPC